MFITFETPLINEKNRISLWIIMDQELIVEIEDAKIVNNKITILNNVDLKLKKGEFV